MKENKKQELKKMIEDVIKDKLEKFKKQYEEEEEKLVEPFKLLEPEEVANIYEFTNLADVTNIESCPSVDDEIEFVMSEEEIAYIPMEGAELEEEEIKELNDLAEEIEPIGERLMIQCKVLDKEKLLIDKVNCNMFPIHLLGIILLTPINLDVIDVSLDAKMKSDEEIEVFLAYKDDNTVIIYSVDMRTLVSEGLVGIIGIDEELLELKPAEFRGVTALVSLDELNKICIGEM